ncbi:acetyl-CoA synthetase [Halobaculum sp. D14]|uniref:acetyl-CoA synthetase n=1 Tax=Halobaculum sp. D14 TaxID=3421642 RepID=UPI003EBB7D00
MTGDTAFADLSELVARDRRSDRAALVDVAAGRERSYYDLCTTAYKAGNVLRYLGVRTTDRVAVEPRATPPALLTFLGAALLGAETEFTADTDADARAVVAHADRESAFDLHGGSRLCVFGGEPSRSDTTHWETEVWSENPAFPPTDHDPDAPVLRGGDDAVSYSHTDVLSAARDAADRLGLDADSRVALRAPLSDPRAVAAGVVAPLLVGGAVVLLGDDRDDADEWTAAVVSEAASESAAGSAASTLSVADVPLSSSQNPGE